MVDSFTSATERHIEVGDGLEIYVVMNSERTAEDLVSEGSLPPGLQVEELGALGGSNGEKSFLIRGPLKRD